jgi:hypothetical protein
METKKIEFTNEQYRNLLKLVYMGHWMGNSHRDEPITELDDIENYLYSFADTFNCTDLIDMDTKLNQHYPTLDFENEMDNYVQDYDEYTFWDELAWRLADRDFEEKYDPAQTIVMTGKEIIVQKDAMVEKYYKEFDKNGLDHLILKK